VRLSSIFSSDSWQARWQWAPWMFFFVGLVIATELLLRLPAVVNRLPAPEPTLWHAELIETKLTYLQAFAAERGIDVLFIGNSTMQAGVDPALFDAARGVETTAVPGSFNASIEGIPPYGASLFLDIFLRYSEPDTIIYGLTPQDLNSNSPWAADITDRVRHSPMALAEARRGIKGQVLAFLLDHSALFRYRLVLYRLLLADPSLRQEPFVYFDERGYHHLKESLADISPDRRGRFYNRAGVLNYSTNGLQTESLRQLIEQTQATGIPLILVNMPLAAEYYGLFDEPQADYALYRQTLMAVADEYNLPLIDLAQGKTAVSFTDAHFADFNHLNQSGAAKLSRALAIQFLALADKPATTASPPPSVTTP
jgi:hypothetical protein